MSDLARTRCEKRTIARPKPWNPKWEREVHTWPYLMAVELVAAVLVRRCLMVWSITLNAPLESHPTPTSR